MYFPLENSCLDSLSQCICSSLKRGQTRTNQSPRHPAPSQQRLYWVNTAAKWPARRTPLLAVPSTSCPF